MTVSIVAQDAVFTQNAESELARRVTTVSQHEQLAVEFLTHLKDVRKQIKNYQSLLKLYQGAERPSADVFYGLLGPIFENEIVKVWFEHNHFGEGKPIDNLIAALEIGE